MTKTLVAYFSASGITKAVAQRLANAIGADLHEIVPAVPYTSADLDWTDKTSRSSVEMKNKASRPDVETKVDSMAQYDVIFLGFPIWWYTAPTIVNTFLEQQDMTGKKVVPFATSGSSGMGSATRDLAASCRGGNVLEGKRFNSDVSAGQLKDWAQKFI